MAGFYENITVSAAVPNAAADAEAAKDAAVTAKNEAEAAKDAAEVAKNLAEQHKDTASGYVGTVSGAQSIADANVASTAGDRQAAEDARDLALAYRQAANVSALSAENSANSVSANAATVAGMADDINLVAGLQNTLITVAADLGIHGTMAAIRPHVNQINTVSGITTEVIAVAADAADIGTVATDLTGSNNIGTVAGLAPKINTVAGLSSELTTVHGNNADITTVATSLNAGNIIANVSSNIGNVNNVGNKLAEIEAVKNALSDIAAVENKLTEIDSVSDSITNVDTVAGAISEVQTVAGVSDEVANLSKSTGNMATLVSKLGQTNDLAGAVTDAQNSATSASSSASTATTQATAAAGSATTAATHAANLGSVAYQDLTAISESKAVTATDVFVYDTSKDSDGGAWRNRTQGTSWYNEPLNTSIRGATKKFPAVAVIVVTNDDILIYDGDDPSLPLWMKFDGNVAGSSGTWWGTGYGNVNGKCVTMKDGLLCAGTTDTINSHHVSGLSTVSFISEKFSKYGGLSGFKYRPIAERATDFYVGTTGIVSMETAHKSTNDVAITVLPNAPIDPDTGLPVPTIAVATFEGVSVIKDDGSIISKKSHLSNYNHHECDNIVFDGEDIVFNIWNNTSYHSVARWDYELTTLKSVYSTYSSIAPSDTVIKLPSGISGNGAGGRGVVTSGDNTSLAYGAFVVNVNEKTGKPKESLVNVINSSYNTGWMNGDIKLATLMDTTAETISAPELVTNGDFSSFGSELVSNGDFSNGTTGWSTNQTTEALQVVNGKLRVTEDGVADPNNARAYQTITCEVGKTYNVSVDLDPLNATACGIYISEGVSTSNSIKYQTVTTAQTVNISFEATQTTHHVLLVVNAATTVGAYADFDNVTVKEVTGWTATNGELEVTNGQITHTNNGLNGNISQILTGLTTGRTYIVSFDLVNEVGNGLAYAALGGHQLTTVGSYQVGTHSYSVTLTSSSQELRFSTYANPSQSFTIDNVSVVEAVADRSVNNNGLNIVGNVTKSAVATGAELVEYGAYSTSSSPAYLEQPYNSDLDFGYGDYCVMFWGKQTTGDLTAVFRGDVNAGNNTGGAGGMHIWLNGGRLKTVIDGASHSPDTPKGNASFAHYVVTRKNGTVYFYQDGVMFFSYDGSTKNVSSTFPTRVITGYYNHNPATNGLALLRISSTAPTPEQIAKIYRDEKPLFQVGAKCTLSSSDDVKAIAYDEDLSVLHVSNGSGSSAYRDEFVGLQNVVANQLTESSENVSACNGLVVED